MCKSTTCTRAMFLFWAVNKKIWMDLCINSKWILLRHKIFSTLMEQKKSGLEILTMITFSGNLLCEISQMENSLRLLLFVFIVFFLRKQLIITLSNDWLLYINYSFIMSSIFPEMRHIQVITGSKVDHYMKNNACVFVEYSVVENFYRWKQFETVHKNLRVSRYSNKRFGWYFDDEILKRINKVSQK